MVTGFSLADFTPDETVLHIGEEKKRFPMEIGKLYCVKCGEWHCISMKPGAKAAVIENDDVGAANTEYLYFTAGL